MNRPAFLSRFSTARAALLCSVAALIFAASTGPATAADEAAPAPESYTVPVGTSAEGRQMLATVLAVAGALVGMERACSWRLGVIRRQAAANRGLAAVLPPKSSADLPRPSWPLPVPSSARASSPR